MIDLNHVEYHDRMFSVGTANDGDGFHVSSGEREYLFRLFRLNEFRVIGEDPEKFAAS